ncbi:hypothetical protein RB614_22350 [Phytohabitans sp. ZYX-F-186]|uniref:Uncharacterized protein n=1 Tax=Phytohabitans maris TaxID=3071409 RepID=A0ABU0ZJM7_9ACTN|nr:hypothetical protein [Phytohabitans sp. ZYX-F-186]MDQ7907260.1 hypothetical protein [Phytohabitans sp. ZYX-F-186]
MDPQRNAPDQADRGWYDRRHGEPEWEGYRLPGPRGAADALEADPLSGGTHAPSQSAYDQQSGYNPLAGPAMEVPAYGAPPSAYSAPPAVAVPAPAAYEVPPAAAQPPPPPGYKSFEEPTGAVPPVTPRPEAEPIETQRFHTEAIDRAALRRPAGPPADGVYRTKRPAAGIVLAVLAVVFEIPALRLLADAAIGGPVVASGVVAGTFLVAGLPLVALGLYALVTGANRLPGDGGGAHAWLRPPTAYLPVGLVLLVAAALAA